MKKTFIKYPCGKMYEIKIPIKIKNNDGETTILPDDDSYFELAKQKFEVNDLKILQKDVDDDTGIKNSEFISLTKKHKAIE